MLMSNYFQQIELILLFYPVARIFDIEFHFCNMGNAFKSNSNTLEVVLQ